MGSQLVLLAVRGMRDGGCDEAVLETEVLRPHILHVEPGMSDPPLDTCHVTLLAL